jgi:hypothetical protein
VAADFENYKRQRKEEWVKFANEDLLKAILPLSIIWKERSIMEKEDTA